VPLSFADAQFITALSAGIDKSKLETFASRLKQWQKKGFPPGTQVGKGARAEYGAAQILQLALMAKLLKVGLTPERAQHVIETGWSAFRDGFIETMLCQANDADHLHYFLIQLNALTDLTNPGSDHDHIFVEILTDEEMSEAWAPAEEIDSDEDLKRYEYFRFVVKNRMALSITVEIDSLLIWIWSAMKVKGHSPEIFAEEFAAWEKERRENGRDKQVDEHEINNDLFRRSIADQLESAPDRIEYARAALKFIAQPKSIDR